MYGKNLDFEKECLSCRRHGTLANGLCPKCQAIRKSAAHDPQLPLSPPSQISDQKSQIISAQPCGCRYDLRTHTMHVPCYSHSKCVLCRGADLVFMGSAAIHVPCPICGSFPPSQHKPHPILTPPASS